MAKNPKGIFQKKKGSKVWHIRYADVSGTIRYEKGGTFSTAQKLLAKRREESLIQRKLPTLARKRVTFAELAADALTYSKANKKSYRSDVVRLNRLVGWIGNRIADTVTPSEIEALLRKQCRTPATSNRYRAVMSLAFRLGERDGKVSSNPARKAKQQRETNAKLRYLTRAEYSRLQDYITEHWPHHWPDVQLSLNTGMRAGEQFGLKWDDVDFDKRLLTLHDTKNGQSRHVQLNNDAVAALRILESQRNGQQWVHLNWRGDKAASPRFWFEQAIKETKCEGVVWHTLRHTFASRLAEAGESLLTIGRLMGHKTLTQTARYAHLSPDHMRAAVDRLQYNQKGTESRTESSTKVHTETGTGTVN